MIIFKIPIYIMTIILIIGKYNGHFLYLAYKELRINILIIRRKSNY